MFHPDGSIITPSEIRGEQTGELEPSQHVLSLLKELPFPVGRKLLAEILLGIVNSRTRKLRLESLSGFGSLPMYSMEDAMNLINELKINGHISVARAGDLGYMPVLKITSKGEKELNAPSKKEYGFSSEPVTDKDRELFKSLPHLEKYNEQQKKAITDPGEKILCVAGAGSGKTSVLTERIRFLVKYRSVSDTKILAITFTRKAKQEMMSRLDEMMPGHNVRVETFNSFSEKVLKKYGDLVYDKSYRVITLQDKMNIVNKALKDTGHTLQEALDSYYSKNKLRDMEQKDLFFSFVGDVFGLIDHSKNKYSSLTDIRPLVNAISESRDRSVALFMYNMALRVETYKSQMGLRDFTDQVVHTLRLFEVRQDLVPEFEHVLVDEYQDVNDLQVRLLEHIASRNMFVVGDPRQSIFGWRGSKIDYIMQFPEKSTVIQLTRNYRSTENIVKVGNEMIRSMGVPDIESSAGLDKPVTLLGHSDEGAEHVFVSQSILSQKLPRNEIFVLARTNRQLEKISAKFMEHGIKFIKRTIEHRVGPKPALDEVTLSTVHAIKGLEAELVYLIGVNIQMYPCQASEHPALDALKANDYDRYEEERRILYVAMTRAKRQLVVNYSGKLSPFFTFEVEKAMSSSKTAKPMNKESQLREWRLVKSRELGIKPYMIFSDKTLNLLLEEQPTSLGELMLIYGFGQAKVMRYGEDIISILMG